MSFKTECALCGQEIPYDEKCFMEGNHGEPTCLTKEECKAPEEWEADVVSDDELEEGGEQ
ncbi:hypothetical protein BCBBV1cgp58 [Bacillus phage BCASJ1c]|uniref:58 n=1 Tax=Bacillus phage BCASJ1c TaxID=294382 RepID=Q5YA52_9CAUD|nr:hypothetical protein BCBBV1cgp58 [Bacillus phage BCASJ1c]AAU85105.1 58 [Bacillus phage BCASJ1c]